MQTGYVINKLQLILSDIKDIATMQTITKMLLENDNELAHCYNYYKEIQNLRTDEKRIGIIFGNKKQDFEHKFSQEKLMIKDIMEALTLDDGKSLDENQSMYSLDSLISLISEYDGKKPQQYSSFLEFLINFALYFHQGIIKTLSQQL